jgi:hypothetical protein
MIFECIIELVKQIILIDSYISCIEIDITIMDEWDSIVNFDQDEYRKGIALGESAANASSEDIQDAFKMGFNQGYLLALELTYIEKTIKNEMNLNAMTERQQKKCETILSKIAEVPRNNDIHFDYQIAWSEIKSLCNSLHFNVGLNRNLKSAALSTDVSW